MADPDRHAPDDKPVNFRVYDDGLKAWLASEPKRRGISRAALIIEALKEKREREAAGVHAASPASAR